MNSLLERPFYWQVGLSEFIGLVTLILLAFFSTYKARKNQAKKYIYALYYGSSILFVSLLTFGLLKFFLLISDENLSKYRDVAPSVNPMGTILYLFVSVMIFWKNNTSNPIIIQNIFIFISIHIIAIVIATIIVFLYLWKKDDVAKHFIGISKQNSKTISYHVLFIFIFVALIYLVNYKLLTHNNEIVILSSFVVSTLICANLFLIISYLGQLNFPSNIYVATSMFFITILLRQTKIRFNLLSLSYTTLSFLASGFIMSLFTFV